MPLASLAVYLGGDAALGHGPGDVEVVDAHTQPLVEVAGAVVPPRELARLGVVQAIGVDQAPFPQRRDGGSFRLRDVRRACEVGHVVDVRILGCDVEIAADHQRLGRIAGLAQPAGQPLEPGQLGFVERSIEGPPIGGVDADHAHSVAHRGHHAGLVRRCPGGLGLDGLRDRLRPG